MKHTYYIVYSTLANNMTPCYGSTETTINKRIENIDDINEIKEGLEKEFNLTMVIIISWKKLRAR